MAEHCQRPNEPWVSLRMRASREGMHVSGAERLIEIGDAPSVVDELLARAYGTAHVVADEVVITTDLVEPEALTRVPVLRARTAPVDGWLEGRLAATATLIGWGVAASAVEVAIRLLTDGANPDGGNMRGACVMDAQSGARLHSDPRRGVRVSFVDMAPADRKWFDHQFGHRFPDGRFRDALILASKVAAVGGVVAELGWSDDPTYVAGYVASRKEGYVRFPHLKERGSPIGGRVYFVQSDSFEMERDVSFLESSPVLVTIPNPAVLKEA